MLNRYSAGRYERIELGMTDSAAFAEQILVEVQSGLARFLFSLKGFLILRGRPPRTAPSFAQRDQ